MIFFLNPSPIFYMAKHPAMLRGTAREEGNSSGLLHSRYFNRQKRNKKERVHRNDVPSLFRAEDEAQTRDPQLGRLMLYQLSYFRNFFCGQRWIRTTEGVSQQIYSLPHLATLVFALIIFSLRKERASVYLSKRINLLILEPLVGFEPTTPRLQITCSGQLS